MPDLHAWISAKVTAVEAAAQACPPWPWRYDADQDAVLAADGIEVADVFALSNRQLHATGEFIAANDPEAVLRRCAADRKILDRHIHDPESATWSSSPYPCRGCGFEGDCDDPVTEHINDCPELLDLAHAHGITDDELAQLDRPARPRREEAYTASSVKGLPPTPTSAVPVVFRGPNWKARP